ncbi:MAG: hypothetical protein ACP5JU_02840 [Minisyncoccia bacterium]
MNIPQIKDELSKFLQILRGLKRNEERIFVVDDELGLGLLKLFYLNHLLKQGYLITIESKIKDKFLPLDLEKELPEIPNISPAFTFIFGELSDNIKEHAHTNEAYFFYNQIDNEEILGVFDAGISIPLRYKEALFDFKEPKEAIKMALEGISTKTKEERGYGLRSIVKIVKSLNGKVLIISGEAIGFIDENNFVFDNLEFFWIGTSVIINASKPSKDFNFLELIK